MRRRTSQLVVASLVCVAMLGGGAAWWVSGQTPKRFAEVAEGRLYRSGELTGAQLERLHDERGIGRVICLLNEEAPETAAEKVVAEQLGLDWQNVSLRGDGASTREDRDRLRALLLDSDAPPTLVHCAAGVNRTGLAVGMYRLHRDGWPLERVLEEMRAFGFEDLPKHEDLRQALAEEAELALSAATSQPGPGGS